MTSNSEPAARRIRVALFGCGKMGLQHLRVLRNMPAVEVVGVADPALAGEEAKALLPRGAIVRPDAASLLSEGKPDAVHIVTPPATHASLALQALQAGCHIFVEKPFTLSSEDAAKVLNFADSRGLRVCAGHQYLFEAPAIGAIDGLDSIGRLVHVESVFAFRTVRRTITPVDQCKDILPHAVYPLLQQMRAGSPDHSGPVEIVGLEAKASGDVYALLRAGSCMGVLIVSLSGRPVEQYQYLVGTSGSLRADYITGSTVRLLGPGAGVGVLFTPFRRSFQTLGGATRTISRLLLGRQGSYPGLHRLVGDFYAAIQAGQPSPIAAQSILETVDLCERIGAALDAAEDLAEKDADARLSAALEILPPERKTGVVLVTGGTGVLGRPVAMELRSAGFRTRVVARRIPPPSRRVAGVEYVACNLAEGLPPEALQDVDAIVHCAAETAGGRAEHERNSVVATRQLIECAARTGIKRLIHISSIAVLKPGRRTRAPLDEHSPVDLDNEERGPYVWAKATAEAEAQRLASSNGISLRVIRPGPLVDYRQFDPPGRLGRELGPWFVAVGSRGAPLSICDVWTAARVIRSYLEDFESAPALVNLVEHPAPTRGDLARRLLEHRPDLKVKWIPDVVIAALNPPAKAAQRLLLKSKHPVDVRSAFSSERYSTELAASVIRKAGPTSIRF